jgi:hypothetical protein
MKVPIVRDIAPCSPSMNGVWEEHITSIFRVKNQLSKKPAGFDPEDCITSKMLIRRWTTWRYILEDGKLLLYFQSPYA